MYGFLDEMFFEIILIRFVIWSVCGSFLVAHLMTRWILFIGSCCTYSVLRLFNMSNHENYSSFLIIQGLSYIEKLNCVTTSKFSNVEPYVIMDLPLLLVTHFHCFSEKCHKEKIPRVDLKY